MNSNFCCTCAGICCHTGPHMYCEKHMGSALRVLADIVQPCPSCAALRAELDQARGQLCRARAALDTHPGGDPSAADVLGHRLVAVEKALSSSSPCAHETRAKELEEAAKWLLSEYEKDHVPPKWIFAALSAAGKEG